jgi:hypothetical protein
MDFVYLNEKKKMGHENNIFNNIINYYSSDDTEIDADDRSRTRKTLISC